MTAFEDLKKRLAQFSSLDPAVSNLIDQYQQAADQSDHLLQQRSAEAFQQFLSINPECPVEGSSTDQGVQ